MLQKLEQIAQQIAGEIERGEIKVNGYVPLKNSLNQDNPYSGYCHAGVARFVELYGKEGVKVFSFTDASPDVFDRGRHMIAIVDGTIVDPTIRQYVADAKFVYAPEEKYLIKIMKNSWKEVNLNQLC